MDADRLIDLLGLKPLSFEGGYYRETYRSKERNDSGKNLATTIYYLLTPETFSHFHNLPTDEIYHFYLGDPVEMLLLQADGKSSRVILGQDIECGHLVQHAVPAGVWQGSRLVEGGSFALMGTTMSPGFDAEDFVKGNRDELIGMFPGEEKLIRELTSG